MTPRRSVHVKSREAIDALTSPLRLEIVQAIGPGDVLNVRELARRVGKPQESLYYHVRKLVAAGLLIESEKRLKGRRYETLYRLKASRIVVGHDPASRDGGEALDRLVASMLRAASREARAAIRAGVPHEANALPMARRARARLTEADRKRVSRLLDEVEKICTRRGCAGKGRLHAVTLMMVPLEK